MKLITTLLAGLMSLLFGCDSRNPYELRNGVWHFDGRPLDISQGDQFKPLTGPFARGADHGYYRGTPIPDSHGPSFESLDERYARDNSRAWFCDTYRKGQEYYTVRHNRVIELEGVEAANFRLLSRGYARDQRRVFFEGAHMAVRDIDSFEVLDINYARDKVTGYHLRKPIPGSDGATFSVIDDNFSKDKTNVYFYHADYNASPVTHAITRVAGAAPDSFVARGGGYATDAHQAYYGARALTRDLANFAVLKDGYAKAGNAIYYRGALVTDADAATFITPESAEDGMDARDSRAAYLRGKRTTQKGKGA